MRRSLIALAIVLLLASSIPAVAAPVGDSRVALPLVISAVTRAPTPTLTLTPGTTLTPTRTATPSLTPTPTRTNTPGPNELVISWLRYSSRDEYITITNNGPAAQTMTNWRIESVVGSQWYTFPSGYVLAANGSVSVHSGPDAVNNPPDDLRWTTAYIWNDSGDEAWLYNAGGVMVDTWGY